MQIRISNLPFMMLYRTLLSFVLFIFPEMHYLIPSPMSLFIPISRSVVLSHCLYHLIKYLLFSLSLCPWNVSFILSAESPVPWWGTDTSKWLNIYQVNLNYLLIFPLFVFDKRVIKTSTPHEAFRQHFFPGFWERIYYIIRPVSKWAKRCWRPKSEMLYKWSFGASWKAGASPERTHGLSAATMWSKFHLALLLAGYLKSFCISV